MKVFLVVEPGQAIWAAFKKKKKAKKWMRREFNSPGHGVYVKKIHVIRGKEKAPRTTAGDALPFEIDLVDLGRASNG